MYLIGQEFAGLEIYLQKLDRYAGQGAQAALIKVSTENEQPFSKRQLMRKFKCLL